MHRCASNKQETLYILYLFANVVICVYVCQRMRTTCSSWRWHAGATLCTLYFSFLVPLKEAPMRVAWWMIQWSARPTATECLLINSVERSKINLCLLLYYVGSRLCVCFALLESTWTCVGAVSGLCQLSRGVTRILVPARISVSTFAGVASSCLSVKHWRCVRSSWTTTLRLQLTTKLAQERDFPQSWHFSRYSVCVLSWMLRVQRDKRKPDAMFRGTVWDTRLMNTRIL